jgi:glycosyltransferase involved in cell wall biosynthesis
MHTPMRSIFEQAGVAGRVHFLGELSGDRLVECYAAMSLFAFASQSETQGMVITEALAAGLPVFALDGPGVEDVLVDRQHGRVVIGGDEAAFAAALVEQLDAPAEAIRRQAMAARRTAETLSQERCAASCLDLYQRLIAAHARELTRDTTTAWEALGARMRDEFRLLHRISRAARDALVEMNGQ